MKYLKYLFFFFTLISLSILVSCNRLKELSHDNNKLLINPDYSQLHYENYGTPYFEANGFKLLGQNVWLDSDKPKIMILYSRPDGDCHVCQADIGGIFAVFDPKNDNWEIVSRSLSFTSEGSWGSINEPPFFLTLGNNQYGFIIKTIYGMGGSFNEYVSIYGLINNSFVRFLTITTGENNEGATDDELKKYSIKVNLFQCLNKEKEFYDIIAEINIKGNYSQKLEDDEVWKLFKDSRKVTFTFKDGCYKVITN